MNRHIERDTLEYCATLGACGLEMLLDTPFQPFVIIFKDEPESEELFAYKILDGRAIRLYDTEAGLMIGLAINATKGVKDLYADFQIAQTMPGHEMDIPTPHADSWYSWSII